MSPGARILWIVAMKLTPVRIELSSLTEDTVLKGTFLDVFSQTYLGAARDAEDKPESGAG